MSALIDGKSKEAFGTTYAALKTKLMDIANSGYFDPAQVEQPPSLPVAAAPGPVPVPSEEVAQVCILPFNYLTFKNLVVTLQNL